MESFTKELNLNRNVVNQGILDLVNKGSTGQRSYIQQLRDDLDDSFATLIEVLSDGQDSSLMVEDKAAVGDFFHSLYLSTRQALPEKGHESLTVAVNDVSAHSVPEYPSVTSGASVRR
jgi:glucose-6-phosphate isomerase